MKNVKNVKNVKHVKHVKHVTFVVANGRQREIFIFYLDEVCSLFILVLGCDFVVEYTNTQIYK